MDTLLLPEHLTILMQLGFRLNIFWVSDMSMNVVYSSFGKKPIGIKAKPAWSRLVAMESATAETVNLPAPKKLQCHSNPNATSESAWMIHATWKHNPK